VHETDDDLRALQRLLDESYASAGEHLRSIFSTERNLSAEALCRALEGVFRLDLAVVTRHGTPLVAPVDGAFFRGRVWFGFPPGSVRGRILRARPAVSATHTRDATVCLVVHGVAREVHEPSPEYQAYDAYLREVYGPVLELSREQYAKRDGTGYDAWIEPRRLFATVPHPEG
jgi:hypothetical protein